MASAFDVSCRTLRYYEEIGLLKSFRNEESLYRYYDEASLKKLEEILFLKSLGLSMKEILKVLTIYDMEKFKTSLVNRLETLLDESNTISRERSRIEKLLVHLDSGVGVKLSDIMAELYHSEEDRQQQVRSYEEEEKVRSPRECLDVRIVQLKPCRVAYYRSSGKSPEYDVLRVMEEWASRRGLLDLFSTRNFGFNNPSPSPESEEYGYEVWLTVTQETEPSGGVGMKDFSGGLYAVISTHLHDIAENWKAISRWVESNDEYCAGRHQCLEEIISPDWFDESAVQFDLYYPILRRQ
ncbi:MAG TPA: effector binding domain-containing protein [Mesotoga sp.]|nr:effector binding domain-containing protein [Mesotoga sp.]HPI17036.1 effector binding domain-containing protein [Mesotoga sp.]HPM94189.1 effector binding domain-containing protein [Mesotoga sp.]HPX22738.1 effector binding domain-containing protein [Mesotoga sp.]HQC57094.1 effector binding domain-containing protein [Mesotoga sp.]